MKYHCVAIRNNIQFKIVSIYSKIAKLGNHAKGEKKYIVHVISAKRSNINMILMNFIDNVQHFDRVLFNGKCGIQNKYIKRLLIHFSFGCISCLFDERCSSTFPSDINNANSTFDSISYADMAIEYLAVKVASF